MPRSVHACRVPPEPSGALRRPLPRRVSVSDAFATPSWDYDFFSIFLDFLSAPIAKRKRRHNHAPPEPRGRAIGECTVPSPSVDPDSRPLMAHESAFGFEESTYFAFPVKVVFRMRGTENKGSNSTHRRDPSHDRRERAIRYSVKSKRNPVIHTRVSSQLGSY